MVIAARPIDVLYAKLGDKVKENVPLAPYTSARIGGPADILFMADTSAELARIVKLMWKHEIGGLPVMVDGRLVGILSESDIFRLVAEYGKVETIHS